MFKHKYKGCPPVIQHMIDNIIKVEGGYEDDPTDRGGKTKYGVTEKVARINGYTGGMKDLPIEFAQDLYVDQYYFAPRFNLVYDVCPSLGEECVDSGINMGQKWPSLWLQQLLNAFNRNQKDYEDIGEDGRIGPATVGALKAYYSKRGGDGLKVLFNAMNSLQTARYFDIVRANPSQERFFYGWLANRVEFVPF